MLQVLVKKADGTVLLRQDSPNHTPGNMKAAHIKLHGGSADDYDEIVVPEYDKADVMTAKEVFADIKNKRVKTILATPEERNDALSNAQIASIKERMIDLQCRISAAEILGFNVDTMKADMDKLKKQKDSKVKKEKKVKKDA